MLRINYVLLNLNLLSSMIIESISAIMKIVLMLKIITFMRLRFCNLVKSSIWANVFCGLYRCELRFFSLRNRLASTNLMWMRISLWLLIQWSALRLNSVSVESYLIRNICLTASSYHNLRAMAFEVFIILLMHLRVKILIWSSIKVVLKRRLVGCITRNRSYRIVSLLLINIIVRILLRNLISHWLVKLDTLIIQV
jgi:hypothetical protein